LAFGISDVVARGMIMPRNIGEFERFLGRKVYHENANIAVATLCDRTERGHTDTTTQKA